MAPSYFEDFEFSFEDDFEEFGTMLTDEFRKARNLLPIKILIDGPPAVGKTTLAKCLADFYKLYYIDVENVIFNVLNGLTDDIEQTVSLLNDLEKEKEGKENDDQDDQDIEDELLDMEDRLRELVEDWKEELVELSEFMNSLKASSTLVNHEKEFDLKKKCILKIISSKACNENQGYVLDGFPFEYSEATEIYPRTAIEGEETEEDVVGRPSPLRPDFVILLDAPDELLCKRAMLLTEKVAQVTKSTEDEFLTRLEAFRARNHEDTSLLTFFYDNDIIPMNFCINEDTKCEDIFEKVKSEIGSPHIYPISKTEKDALIRFQNELRAKQEMAERRIQEEAAAREREEREANLCKWTKEFERLKCKEQEFLEAKTLPLRQYLTKFVLPTLTDGLVRVAEIKPEDPVDFLAEYLFETNPTGHVLDPAYSRKIKRLLLDEGDEDISKALDMMPENETEFDCGLRTKKKKPIDSPSSSSASASQRDVEASNLARILMRELRSQKNQQE